MEHWGPPSLLSRGFSWCQMAEPPSILPGLFLVGTVSGAAVNIPWESVQLQVPFGSNRKPCTSRKQFSIPACLESVLLCSLCQPERPFEATLLIIYPRHSMLSLSSHGGNINKELFLKIWLKDVILLSLKRQRQACSLLMEVSSCTTEPEVLCTHH